MSLSAALHAWFRPKDIDAGHLGSLQKCFCVVFSETCIGTNGKQNTGERKQKQRQCIIINMNTVAYTVYAKCQIHSYYHVSERDMCTLIAKNGW